MIDSYVFDLLARMGLKIADRTVLLVEIGILIGRM